MAKKAAVHVWHRARDFDRGPHQSRHRGGAVDAAALQVLHNLVFDFLNRRTGHLDPSYAAIAAKAGVGVRGGCGRTAVVSRVTAIARGTITCGR